MDSFQNGISDISYSVPEKSYNGFINVAIIYG